jgi:hypothetical protein
VDKFDFDKIVYRKPFLRFGSRYIRDVIGLDSETLLSGKPFLFCTSLGDSFTLDDIPLIFFSRKYRGKNLVVYNLKFDSGSLLYKLPLKTLNELREKTEVEFEGYHYTYIPHKLLRIRKGKNAVSFWDILGFFKMSLDRASHKYLNDTKKHIETKKFHIDYVRKNLEHIKEYCIYDSQLTRRLALYLLEKLHVIKLYPNTLYSTASISFQYFKQNSRIVTSWDLWENNREVLRYACNSYYGGKVEITSRGTFKGYEYDINSAYAAEISNLINIKDCKVIRSHKYVKEAAYAFYRVYINDLEGISHSIVVKVKNMNIYPVGSFYAYITKPELEYLQTNNVDVKIIDAYHLLVGSIEYPYRETVNKLQRIKEEYKNKDIFVSEIAKLCNNSFYGKMCQLIEDYEGYLNAGVGWNPVYAATITANVRLKVAEIQNIFKGECLSVHTDAVITTRELPKKYLGDGLGAMLLKRQGNGIMIMSGMYKLAEKNAYRGFKMPSSFDWFDKLSDMGDSSKTELTFNEAKSWITAVVQKKIDEINRFSDNIKTLDLNSESKRLWLRKTNAHLLLTELERSLPKVYIEPYTKGA